MIFSRRDWLLSTTAAMTWRDSLRNTLLPYLAAHKRTEGGYGWSSDVVAHTTPTFAVVGCYEVLRLPVPDSHGVAEFVRNNYPVPERRRTDRPLWRLDWEQIQTLLWLKQPVAAFRPLAETWTRPAEFTRNYELDGNPVFQHQAMAVRARALLGLGATKEWTSYFAARRRPDGSYNHTLASDGSGGHLLNTLWGVLASRALGLPAEVDADWIRRCQQPSGGFSCEPASKSADIAYTWAALQLGKSVNADACIRYVSSLLTSEGGFQDAAGGEPNPLATYYALDSLRLLNRGVTQVRSATRALRSTIPNGARVYSIQIEAPGQGSISEAVEIAGALGIHLWTAKNAKPAWIDAANRSARDSGVPVHFYPAGEDYGTYYSVPGLGTYSHLIDWVAAKDPGPPMPKKQHKYSLADVREGRFKPLRDAGGTLIWQFLENEELTRSLLDGPDYDAIATFHFGNENFLHSQPYLHRWFGRKAFVALQDAHGKEAWWWTDMLGGFTTLYVATQPGWRGWQDALRRNHVMAVRHDAITKWRTHMAGGSPELRDYIMRREHEWRWWDSSGQPHRRPVAALTPVPGGLRIRLWADNNGQGLPKQPRAELVSLEIDGTTVSPEFHESRDDRYWLLSGLRDGEHHARATVSILHTGETRTVEKSWHRPEPAVI
jgi:hypothetical protein